MLDTSVIVFIDDILVYSKDNETHATHLSIADVTKLFSFYESYDRVIQLHVFVVEVPEFPSPDYTLNGFHKGLMTRPSARQLRRLAGGSRIGHTKSSVKTSSVATITIEGSLRDSGKTKATTRAESGNQCSTSNSSASADDTSSRHVQKLTPIWLEDDEGSIHSSKNSDREYGDEFGVSDTEEERGGVSEREDVLMEGVGDIVNEIEDGKDFLNYISDEPREEGEYVIRAYDIDQLKVVKMEVGQVFQNITAFRHHLKDFVIQEGTEIIRLKNEKHRVTTICAKDGCPWRVHASTTKDKVSFMVKTFWS
ncbi:hypothetical protein NE237_012153 [Protea cynaroides]|uniref:Transposase MuDR plant domain-containing protein n=1 Tax=Protea cynaroides TaxID=273540 RepID=A0A9Q0JYJ6_9MAGN|nr:hypothetical protein NE237_012153 [Protea cynaroides]